MKFKAIVLIILANLISQPTKLQIPDSGSVIIQIIESISALNSKPSGIDLSVTYMSREPRHEWTALKQWPDTGELVTFTAHVKNKGTVSSTGFDFLWKMDGQTTLIGDSEGILPDEEATFTLDWPWQPGRHEVTFEVDPLDQILETFESNNSLTNVTDALTIAFWVEDSVYDEFNNIQNGAGTYSWEDWAQRIVSTMNGMFEKSVYPLAPKGILTRVRLDNITIVPDGTLFNQGPWHAPYDTIYDGRWGFSIEEYSNCQCCNKDICYDMPWWVIHELGHYLLGRVDLYGLDVQDVDVNVLDEIGNRIAGTPLLPYIQFDVVHYVSRIYDVMHNPDPQSVYSDHNVYSLNRDWPQGQRTHAGAGYIFEIPHETILKVLDTDGSLMENVEVSVYQAVPGDGSSGPYSQNFDNIPDIVGITDSQGLFSLGATPFGDYEQYGIMAGIILLKLKNLDTGVYRYIWVESVNLNLAYWGGETETYTHPVNFPDGPMNLNLSHNDLSFTILQGVNQTQAQKVNVSLIGEGNQYWSVGESSVPWLRTIPSSDIALSYNSYPPGPLTFIADSSGLPPGTYTTELEVDAGQNTNDSPQTIEVALHIKQPTHIYLPVIFHYFPPLPQMEFHGLVEDAELLNLTCDTWDECRNSSSSNSMWLGLHAGSVGATYDESGYRVQRIFLYFDTSTLPENAEIVSVKLHVYSGPWKNGVATFHVVRSTAYFPPSYSDFDQFEPASGGMMPSPPTDTWLSIDLSSEAFEWVHMSGVTKLALIHDFDLNDVVPIIANDTGIRMSEHSEAYGPRLEVTYYVP